MIFGDRRELLRHFKKKDQAGEERTRVAETREATRHTPASATGLLSFFCDGCPPFRKLTKAEFPQATDATLTATFLQSTHV